MTNKDLHRILLKRLLPVLFVLTILVAAVVYYLELENIDAFVENLAIGESRAVLVEYGRHWEDPQNMDLGSYIRKGEGRGGRGAFIVIELYNKEKKLVAEAVRQGSEQIELEMDKYRHEALMQDDVNYRKIYINRQLFIMVMVPLKIDDSVTGGYFEGVYEVDDAVMKDIKDRVIWSVCQVIAVIFITALVLYPIIISLNRELIKRSEELYRANLGMLEILGNAIAKRDSDTNTHNYRVTIYAIRLAEALGLGREEMKGLIKGAFLHDLGKIAISDNILHKPAGLTPEEMEVMKTHVQHGVEIISDYRWLGDALDVVSCHHEKYDGGGFLKGMHGENIPLPARIFAVCDVFDALTSRRPYKEPFSYERSLEMIMQLRGNHFDPRIVDAFSRIVEKLYAEICDANEDFLKNMMKQLIDRYFEVQLPVPDDSSGVSAGGQVSEDFLA